MLAEPLANLLLAAALRGAAAAEARAVPLSDTCLGIGCWRSDRAFRLDATGRLFALDSAGRLGSSARAGARVFGILAALALAAPNLLGIGLWQNHNAQTFGNGSFTSIGAFNLLYYRAAAALHLAQGRQDIDAVKANLARRVEKRLGNSADDIIEDWRARHRAPTAPGEAAMRQVALEVIKRHPAEFALAALVGAHQSLVEVWGALTIPGAVWNIALLFAAALGLRSLFYQRRWLEAMFLLLPCLYFIAGTVLVCTTCMDTRARVMITPLLAIMAAYGVFHWLNRRRAVSASPSPPVGI